MAKEQTEQEQKDAERHATNGRIIAPDDATPTYYEILGVDAGADADSLAEAYAVLRQRHHPDRNPDDPLAPEIVRYLDGAYAVLIDPERRRAYDATLSNGISPNGVASWMNGVHSASGVNGHAPVMPDAPRASSGSNGVAVGLAPRRVPEASAEETIDEGGRRGRGRSARLDRDLTSGSIPKNLWFLAWPQMVEGVLNVADQMADLFWAGRGFGARAIAGLGAAQSYTQLMMTGRMGFDTAMRAMISRAVGAGDVALANHVALQSFTLSGGFSLIMVVLGVFFTESLLHLLGISEAVIAQGAPYMRVQLIGMATQAFRMMSGAALQASGDTMTPMKATAVVRVVHIVLAPFLAFGWWWFPSFGLMGLAMANVLAQLFGVAMNFHVLFSGTSRLHLSFRGYRLDFGMLGTLVRIGAPASVTSMERSIAQIVLVGLVAVFGDYALAAYSLTRRVEMFANLGSQGMGQASGIIVGQSLGAKKPERAKETVLWASAYVTFMKTVFGALVFAFPLFILSIFNQEPELLSVAVVWLRIQVAGYLAMGVGQVAMQSFNTAGDTLVPMLVTLATIWGVQQPLAFYLPHVGSLGQYGIAWAISIAMIARLFFYVPYFFWGPWTKKQVLTGGARRGMGMRGGQ
ncbi:MAG TPA: MATE family efflux transporter [Dehalococcoidia bacterium]|nr:MATE family efflux transporter [Dehalococcoidia bacterium]